MGEMYLLCTGILTSSGQSTAVTGFSRLASLTETPMWVPSQASMAGLCLHQGSISSLKSTLKAIIQPKIQLMKVVGDMNLATKMLVVWYTLVTSLQKPVKEILLVWTLDKKSQPISSPAPVLFDTKKIPCFAISLVGRSLHVPWRHFLERILQWIGPFLL